MQTYYSRIRRDSVCNTFQDPIITSVIDAKKITAWGESGFPASFLGVALAGLTIWDAVTNDATDAAASRIISAACRQLKRETEVLWRQIQVDAVAPDHVEATLQAIQSRWEATLQWAEPETDKGMNKATQLAANAEMAQFYGISTTA